jgi:hypothetical protein
MTAAQTAAKAKFKKAIAYRQKTGVSLKEAFAHVYGKKVGAAPKKKATKKAAPKKAAKKVVKKKAAPKKAPKKHTKYGVVKKHVRRVAGIKKPKPIKEQSILNKIHKVKDQVNQLDELQHKHMSKIGASSYALYHNVSNEINKAKNCIVYAENHIIRLKSFIPDAQAKKSINMWKDYIKEQKTHIAQLKKHI